MTYRGRIKNGVVVFDKKVSLPEGTEVEVVLAQAKENAARQDGVPTLYEQLEDIIGVIKGLPPDFAENHDHYIHGCPKK